jgi:HEAT repeat protein
MGVAPFRLSSGLVVLALGATALLAATPRDDVSRKLEAREPTERLAAVETIRRDGHEQAEKLLVSVLDDRDWEVVDHAARALGERGTPAGSAAALSALVIDGPIRRIRLAAAESLAKLDPAAAGELLTKAAKGPNLPRACEGLAAVAATLGERARAGLEAGLLSKESSTRAIAASGLHAFPPGERAPHLVTCLGEEELTIGAAALDSATRHPDAALLPTLIAQLEKKGLPVLFERRIGNAIEALLLATKADGRGALQDAVLDAARRSTSDPGLSRHARLVGRLAAKREGGPLLDAEKSLAWLEQLANHSGDGAPATAAKALGLIATDASLGALARVAASHGTARVRSIALRGLVAAGDEGKYRNVAIQLTKDSDLDVREDAAVALGRPKMEGAVAALVPLLKDAEWPVAVAAAVSLGKTRDSAALAPLVELAKHKEWKLAGAALVGLGHLKDKGGMAALIAGVGEKSPTLKLTAHEFLRRMTHDKIPPKESGWKSWWSKAEGSFQFPDPDEDAKQAQKYGYAQSSYGVYEDLDVLVFQSRGDHIEKLLDKLKVNHRVTQGGGVPDSGVTPLGIYVANCTGECGPNDLEQVQWAVHAGAYLFSSCWAITYHSQEVRPGFVRGVRFDHTTDLVTAEPCLESSPYLQGVFDGVTRPSYALDGPHLIEVLDPERVEVLIDSPECATKYRTGDLAAWWTIGHGLILDSVNHFDLQGFGRAPPMKEPQERMAYAVDVLGLSYADLRDVPKGAWQSQQKAAEEVRDLSAFRFITNFVRQKRKSGV